MYTDSVVYKWKYIMILLVELTRLQLENLLVIKDLTWTIKIAGFSIADTSNFKSFEYSQECPLENVVDFFVLSYMYTWEDADIEDISDCYRKKAL